MFFPDEGILLAFRHACVPWRAVSVGVGPVPVLVRSAVSAVPWLAPAPGSAGSRAHYPPLCVLFVKRLIFGCERQKSEFFMYPTVLSFDESERRTPASSIYRKAKGIE